MAASQQNDRTVYYKITKANVDDGKNGNKEYLGLFVSGDKKFECNIKTFIKGWEVAKLTPEIEESFTSELLREADNKGFVKVE